MIKVLFAGNNLRQRLRETILNPPKGVDYIPLNPINNMPKDYHLTGSKSNLNSNTKINFILKVIYFFKIPNIRYINNKMLKNIELIHTPGQLLFNNKNYVIEIDNYSILALYNIKAIDFFMSRAIIKHYLKKNNCKKLICISNAAKNSVINTFNDNEITKKCVVLYPYVSKKNVKFVESKEIKLLFISSEFYLKGGRETLSAFARLSKKYPNISLTLITKISNIEPDIFKKYSKFDNIHFVEGNLSKEKLYNDYYLKSDIFVMPTYQDSFGLVFLEAISSGLAVITTDMFAISEMVENGKNGYLLESPVKYYNGDFTLNKKWFQKDIPKYVKENPLEFKKVETTLYKHLNYLLENKEKIVEMRKKSYEIYKAKFHDDIRKEKLKKIYMESI